MTFIMPFIFFVLSVIMAIIMSIVFAFVVAFVVVYVIGICIHGVDRVHCTLSSDERIRAKFDAVAEKARLQVAADRFAADKTKAVGGFIDFLASCNITSVLLVSGGLFAIFCAILFTIST